MEESTTAVKLNKERLFGGNPNYLQLFNAHCDEYISKEDGIWPSFVSHRDRPTSLGTRWSTVDKEAFFELLARYSIHNVDMIASLLQKSEEDVLNYYHRLKELLNLKKKRRKFYKLIRMDEMPIAYEMSQAFINMENEQLQMLVRIEKRRAQDHYHRFKISVQENDLFDMKGAENLLRLYDDPLVKNRRLQPKVVSDLYSLLNEYISEMTRRIILDFIITSYSMKKKRNHENAEAFKNLDQGKLALTIDASDILLSATKCYPNGPHRLEDYWSSYIKRNRKRIRDISRTDKVPKERKNEESLDSDDDDSIFSLGSSDEAAELESLDTDSDIGKNIGEKKSLESNSGPAHIPVRDISRVKRRRLNHKRLSSEFIIGEMHSLIDNKLAEEVFMKEARYLNDEDLKNSQYHEHILLTFLSTANLVKLKDDEKTMLELLEIQTENEQRPPDPKDCYEEDDENIPEEVDDELLEEDEATPEMVILHLYDYAKY